MTYTDCDHCGKKEIPVNDTLRIDGKVYCAECLAVNFPDADRLQGHVVERQYDPAVCTMCGTDNGDMPLPSLAGRPLCDECREKIRKKIMPSWVKFFFAAVVIIVIFSFSGTGGFIRDTGC